MGDRHLRQGPANREIKNKGSANVFYCKICDVHCTSKINLKMHFIGIKHRKNEKTLKNVPGPKGHMKIMETNASKSVKRNVPRIDARHAYGSSVLEQHFRDMDIQDPIIGLNHVIECRTETSPDPMFFCELCNCQGGFTTFIPHLLGFKHRLRYMNTAYPGVLQFDREKLKQSEVNAIVKEKAGLIEKNDGRGKIKLLRSERLEIDPRSPEASDKFELWLRCFNVFLQASTTIVQSDADKLHLLFSRVGHRIYPIVRDCETFTEAIDILKAQYLAQVNEVDARNVLAMLKQQPGESIDDYQRARGCKAVSAEKYTEELRSDSIRQSEMKLQRPIEQAKTLEVALHNVDSFSTDNMATAAGEHPKCYFCGQQKHPRKSCPAKNMVCSGCGKKGHYTKVCKSKQPSNPSNATCGQWGPTTSLPTNNNGMTCAPPSRTLPSSRTTSQYSESNNDTMASVTLDQSSPHQLDRSMMDIEVILNDIPSEFFGGNTATKRAPATYGPTDSRLSHHENLRNNFGQNMNAASLNSHELRMAQPQDPQFDPKFSPRENYKNSFRGDMKNSFETRMLYPQDEQLGNRFSRYENFGNNFDQHLNRESSSCYESRMPCSQDYQSSGDILQDRRKNIKSEVLDMDWNSDNIQDFGDGCRRRELMRSYQNENKGSDVDDGWMQNELDASKTTYSNQEVFEYLQNFQISSDSDASFALKVTQSLTDVLMEYRLKMMTEIKQEKRPRIDEEIRRASDMPGERLGYEMRAPANESYQRCNEYPSNIRTQYTGVKGSLVDVLVECKDRIKLEPCH
ncbi:uncharacterized protein [Narcine bancroftii]|uniref:uncharacterized protein isoform X2 n=1 Tax=Narcine bancroftii TaxID=1343680 RepID=UPI0038312B0E